MRGSRVLSWINRLLGSVALLACAASGLAAQEGGLFLMLPFGSRAVGMGEAVSADSSLGTEAMWWNAAGLARLTKKELAVHNVQSFIANTTMLAFSAPSKVLGTLAGSAYLVDYGDQENSDNNGNILGNITNRSYQLAVSYATPIGKSLSAGLTYKFIMLRFACAGICGDVPVRSGSTNAVDFGAQYVVPIKLPVTLGLSVRNIGQALSVKDRAQADQLPRIVQGGVRVRVPLKALDTRQASLEVAGDMMSASALGGSAAGIGAELGYRDQLYLRGGYKMQAGEGGGPSLGFGFQRGALGFEVARRFDLLSTSGGNPPTYVTLRARF
ncbi:MAG: PorV/PorQ family protein [Gemmatimonadaceae bacterium]|nr:PorV/PorQ family protein [Gemmatimonadaceae bacterium]